MQTSVEKKFIKIVFEFKEMVRGCNIRSIIIMESFVINVNLTHFYLKLGHS